jgi:RNA polymerase sigma-70 factor (ECF subfamily)
MSGKSNKNDGVRIIANFKDRAIPLSGARSQQDAGRLASRSANQGIIPLAEFGDQAQPLQRQETDPIEVKRRHSRRPGQQRAARQRQETVQVSAEKLADFRPYLKLVARLYLGRRLQAKLDVSDVVQDTLTAACGSLDQFRGEGDAQLATWLEQILAHRVSQVLRYYNQQARDVRQEQPLEDPRAIEESSARIEAWLAVDESSVDERASRKEQAVRLAAALEQLPDAQREAVVLRHLEGLSLAEIGRHLGRNAAAVSGLLQRGLRKLRALLEEAE